MSNRRKSCVHHAIRKYGVKNFDAEIVWRGSTSLLNSKEMHFIKKLHTFIGDPKGRGYNLTKGGDGGRMDAVLIRRQMSRSAIDRAKRPGESERRSNLLKAMWADKSRRPQMILDRRGRKASALTKRRMRASHARFWKEHPEARLQRSRQSKLNLSTEEARAAHSERLKKALATPAARKLKSKAAKKFWARKCAERLANA
jgi:hypothetical protein